MLWTDNVGVKNITTMDIGICPKTIAVNEKNLSSSFLTIAFHTACRNAAKITTKNIFNGMIYIVFKRQILQYKFK